MSTREVRSAGKDLHAPAEGGAYIWVTRVDGSAGEGVLTASEGGGEK